MRLVTLKIIFMSDYDITPDEIFAVIKRKHGYFQLLSHGGQIIWVTVRNYCFVDQ